MCALGDEVHCLTNRSGRRKRDGCVEYEMTTLYPGHDVAHDLKRNVLRYDGDATSTRDGLRHTSTSNSSHVGNDDGNRGASSVVGGQIDIESRGNIGTGRNHEHVIKREVGLWGSVVKEAHVDRG